MKTVILTFLIGSLLLLSPPVSSIPLYEQPSPHTVSIYIKNFPANFTRAYNAYRSSSFAARYGGIWRGIDIPRNNYTPKPVASIPEPSSLLIMVAGLAALGLVSSRRLKKAKSFNLKWPSNLAKKQGPIQERR